MNLFDYISVDVNGTVDLNRVLVLYERQIMPYQIYKALNPEADDEDEVTQYAGFVGSQCAKRILLYRS